MNIQEIEKKLKYALIGGGLFGLYSLILSILAILNIYFFLNINYTASSFLDVIIIFSLTYGIYRKNVASAVLLFMYILFSQLFSNILSGQWSLGLFSILLIWLFIDGIRALIAYHKMHEERKASVGLIIFHAVIIFLVFMIISYVFTLIRANYLVSQDKILTSNTLDNRIIEKLIEAEFLSKDERILFLYSDKLVHKEKSFIFISNEKIVNRLGEFDDNSFFIKNNDIEKVNFVENELFPQSGIIHIIRNDSTAFWVPITKDQNYAERFYKNIKQVLNNNGITSYSTRTPMFVGRSL